MASDEIDQRHLLGTRFRNRRTKRIARLTSVHMESDQGLVFYRYEKAAGKFVSSKYMTAPRFFAAFDRVRGGRR